MTVQCTNTSTEGLTMVYPSDAQTMARGPYAAPLEVLSGPRQILK